MAVAVAVTAASADYMMLDGHINIMKFVKPERAEYYGAVMGILTYISEITGADPFIFGGFVRDIIRYFYRSENDLKLKHSLPADVDVFLAFNCAASCMSLKHWNAIVRAMMIKLRAKYRVTDQYMTPYDSKDVHSYCMFSCLINGIRFEFTTHINQLSFEDEMFNRMIDYTVNNLCINLAGIIGFRVYYDSSDSVRFVIEDHIKYKKLYCISTQLTGETDAEFQKNNAKRLRKMQSHHGYWIPEDAEYYFA